MIHEQPHLVLTEFLRCEAFIFISALPATQGHAPRLLRYTARNPDLEAKVDYALVQET